MRFGGERIRSDRKVQIARVIQVVIRLLFVWPRVVGASEAGIGGHLNRESPLGVFTGSHFMRNVSGGGDTPVLPIGGNDFDAIYFECVGRLVVNAGLNGK